MQEITGEERGQQATDVAAAWGPGLAAVYCPRCRRAHLVPEPTPGAKGGSPRCPFCLQGSDPLQPAPLREEPPEQLLPYEISEQQLNAALEQWAQGIWFRPTELQPATLKKRLRRYLIPLWLVDGRMKAAWRADAGFDYQVVSYQDRYSDGRGWSSQEVQETRTQWEPRAGRLDRSYENVATPALEDHGELMGELGDYDLDRRTGYSPQAAAGAAVRIPSLSPEAAWPGAQAAFVHIAQAECQQAAEADRIRDLVLEAEYENLNWTMLLLPAYVTWYTEGGRAWPVLANGQNGHVGGVRRADSRKANITSLIVGVVALLLAGIGAALALLGVLLPPLVLAGGILLVIGLLLAVAAPIPAIWVWVFNRRSSLTRI